MFKLNTRKLIVISLSLVAVSSFADTNKLCPAFTQNTLNSGGAAPINGVVAISFQNNQISWAPGTSGTLGIDYIKLPDNENEPDIACINLETSRSENSANATWASQQQINSGGPSTTSSSVTSSTDYIYNGENANTPVSPPSKLNFAVQGTLELIMTNGSSYNCPNTVIGQEKDGSGNRWWIYSNTSAPHALNCYVNGNPADNALVNISGVTSQCDGKDGNPNCSNSTNDYFFIFSPQ